ncbi:ABC transporter ATP-binding protein [Kordiimonas sp. SCSIO 12603]|uniref:ABC transporter ATP-binding protein n=1 Tax=Kordiimonas sp. SCSIO 12603 TaxID=2829596 RepID=UPI002104893C|nr:ABC transporter ATP-binding protein [Kordiimonas sp. SCSIO 12603]UTW59750.1 ABC transporter ATP-binding protein [Kordiimonas sp. SCSIO 12603]
MDYEPLLSVSVLQKRFGERIAIDGFDLTLEKGQVYGLLGANGGGKTTCLRMLAGLLPPDGGFGTVLGYNLEGGDRKAFESMRHRVGYMAQKHSLYDNLTVEENLRFRADVYCLRDAKAAVAKLIEEFELSEYRNARARELSGGWARKLQLAAALVHGPELVLLDEPTAGLDAYAKAEVWECISKLADKGVGVIVSTHDLMEAQRCDKASFFVDGSIVASGTLDEIIGQSLVTRVTFLSTDYEGYFKELSEQPYALSIVKKTDGSCLALPSEELPALMEFSERKGIPVQMQTPTIEDAALALVRGWSEEKGGLYVQ